MKKQASPAPTPRAAALSQSASRFSAGATSAWQNIVGNSPRLAAAGPRQPGAARIAAPLASAPNAPGASRVALEPQRAAGIVAPAADQETIRQVGWREVDRAIGMSTKRKYSVFGVGFGPKVPVFETEKVKLPVYQETNREKRYYAVVKAEQVDQVKRKGLASAGKAAAPQTVAQFNEQDTVCFFASMAGAHACGRSEWAGHYALVEFVMPEFKGFTLGELTKKNEPKASEQQEGQLEQGIPVACIKSLRVYGR